MAVTKKSISTLIEAQLPEFIYSEYELFGKFVTKYYEHLENQGGTLDVLSNIDIYGDINYYEKKLLKQSTTLSGNITDSVTTITVDDATSFPEENGYIKIDDEILFYKSRTDTEFKELSRGVSGNTTLGDLYSPSTFATTAAASHSGGSVVQNISNLFLYALVKSFESQYLGSFPEKYLKGEIDKRTLIKNIRKFYQAKGTESSVRFIFNTLVAGGEENAPTVYAPKDRTYKSSESDWVKGYALKAKVTSGNANDLVGKVITQTRTETVPYASATVDNVRYDSTVDGEDIYNIYLATETINGEFKITSKTELIKEITTTAAKGDTISVFSTLGWGKTGTLLIGNETFTFDSKNAIQFNILTRQSATNHNVGTDVYEPIELTGNGVNLLSFGLIYNLDVSDGQPYASTGDAVEIGDPGFSTADVKITDITSNNTRWRFRDVNDNVNAPGHATIQNKLFDVLTEVSAIFEDDQYYYIAASGYPKHAILDGATGVSTDVKDQKLLKLIRKYATRTTEIYETPNLDVGIFLNGTRAYSYKDTEHKHYGKLEGISILTQGSRYQLPPYVLVEGVAGKATANLSGEFVESVTLTEVAQYSSTPTVEILSGRGAVVRAIVTNGKVTSLVADNKGEWYSSPPVISIRDNAGRGRFAEFNAIVENGKITGFTKISEGEFYTQSNVSVTVTPVGSGATAKASLRRWVKNRYYNLKNKLDSENGYLFENYNKELQYGYGQVGNPKTLRHNLGDNLSATFTEPTFKVHSPIIGFAYDGNPIYGAWGYTDPLDATSSIVRMTSSYIQKTTRSGGPVTSTYPLGTYIDDYEYRHRSGLLDENNGRFCITPEYPNGTYAYFLTIDDQQNPIFPYILGKNFYSLPVDSNYNSNLSQDDIPVNARRLSVAGITPNGGNVIATINDIKSGSIESVDVVSSSSNFSNGSELVFDNVGTEGIGAESAVSSIKGKTVNFLESAQTKASRLEIIRPAYLFKGDRLTQPATGTYGEVVGDVVNDTIVVLRDVQGTFDKTNTFSAQIKVLNLLLDRQASYAVGSVLKLTDGAVAQVAFGEVLKTTSSSNNVTVKVRTDLGATGTAPFYFQTEDNLADHYLQSDSLSDTTGSRIVSFTSLSDGLEPFVVNQNVALVETGSNHGIGLGDAVDISINPNDATTTTTYYARKRIYQDLILRAPTASTTIDYSGIGRLLTVNVGWDYTDGSYTNIPLTGGSGSGAKANITVAGSYVTEIQITTGGTGYKRQDILGVADDSLVRSGASISTQRLKVFVDHVGISGQATQVNVADASRFADNDLVKIDDEIVKISSISGNVITIARAQESTTAVDHYDKAPAVLYNGKYNFGATFKVNESEDIVYDSTNQTIQVAYPSTTALDTLQGITQLTQFFDESNPKRLVDLVSATTPENKFEFRKGLTGDFVKTPNIIVQEYYKYKFDTSDNSLTGIYLDFSPSARLNLIPVEKTESTILPGNPGAYIDLKFGFGARSSTNTYTEKKDTEFSSFYYYDKNGICSSDNSYITISKDPLTGRKVISYVTSNRFVYDLDGNSPEWDGSGSITYTTTSAFAVGEVNTIKVTSIGDNYKKTPLVLGINPSTSYRAAATVLYDTVTKSISGVNVTEHGSNYSQPKVVITNGDGQDASFTITSRDGKVLDIQVRTKGKGYTKAPEIAVIEGDVKVFARGSDIGVPKNVSIVRNGAAFHGDKTLYSDYNSSFVYVIKDYPVDAFQKGEVISQTVNNIEVARGKVVEWREGSNLLKVSLTSGAFRENHTIKSIRSGNTGKITATFVTVFSPAVKSTYDNQGYFTSDRGRIGNANQRITDSFFYQDYSYVIRSRTPVNIWRDLIKTTTHPAGLKMFGEVIIDPKAEGDSGATMPVESPKARTFSVINLWDPDKNKITVESTKRIVTQSIQKLEDYRSKTGTGSVGVEEFNFQDLIAQPVKLAANFDGQFNSDGQLIGTKTFQLQNAETNQLVYPYNEQALIITLDGVIQEPGVAFTVTGNSITFAAPPLGEDNVNGSVVPQQVFLGKLFEFKSDTINAAQLRKVKNIYQRSGRWIDAANQINLNQDFIVNETIGWFEAEYDDIIKNSTIPWNLLEQRFKEDIRLILSAVEHDIRFGGNVKAVDYAEIYKSSYEGYEVYIKAAFNYSLRLARLAIRNWDWVEVNAAFTAGSDIVEVNSGTANIAIGATLSAGIALPFANNIRVIEILSDTEIRVSAPAQATAGSAPPGSSSPGTTFLNGTATGNVTLATGTGAVQPPNTYRTNYTLAVPPVFTGDNQINFSFSGINNGQFVDGSFLIGKNKDLIVDYAVNWAKETYPGNNWPGKEYKCRRDLGYFIDAVVKHLKYGGNTEVVQAAELHFVGSKLDFIDDSLTQALETYKKALVEVCPAIIRQSFNPSPYSSLTPFVDNNIPNDPYSPSCAEVESSLNTFYDIIEEIITTGPNVIEKTNFNPNKRGYYTQLTPYSNIGIIPDAQLTSSECADVVSAVDSLNINILNGIGGTSATRSLPDYIDGETTIFDLFWEDGTKVNLSGNEDDLFVALNGVLQRSRYDSTIDTGDAYYIDRSKNPNQLVFDNPPIWDQDITARTLGEPTAVEKFFAYNVGNYRRFTIDKTLIQEDGSSAKGPFLVVGTKSNTVTNITDHRFLVVLINGVIQKYQSAYTISGPNITFVNEVKKEDVIDIRLLYGGDYEKVVTFYDHEPNSYLVSKNLTVSNGTTIKTDIDSYAVYNKKYDDLWVYQERGDGTINPIGKIFDYGVVGTDLIIKLSSANSAVESTFDVKIGALGNPGTSYSIVQSSNTCVLSTNNVAADGTIQLVKQSLTSFTGYNTGNPVKRVGFWKLFPGDEIKVDGESEFRTINKVADKVYSKEYRTGADVTSDHYGTFEVTPFNGITRGEGLSVVATVDGGKVTALSWNKKVTDFTVSPPIIAQPTAYQYYTPPVLEFVPTDGAGGGARAMVTVDQGQVIGVDLIDGGSGYTSAPKVIVTRKYKIRKANEIQVDAVSVGIVGVVPASMRSSSTLTDIISPTGNIPPIARITSIIGWSEFDVSIRNVDCIWPAQQEVIAPGPQPGSQEVVAWQRQNPPTAAREDLDSEREVTAVLQIQPPKIDVIVTKDVYINLQRPINNSFIENTNYYANAAFLDVDCNVGDSIVYVPDTSKFTPSGKILVGTEIIFYPQKQDDRFLFVTRGVNDTTEQTWAAGTYVRQIPDVVSVVPGGINVIHSISSVEHATHLPDGEFSESYQQWQAKVEFVNSVFEPSTNFEIFTPPAGLVDMYQEEYKWCDPISTRLNGMVDLIDDPRTVTQRDGTVVEVRNEVFGTSEYQSTYIVGNLGHNIGDYQYTGFDDGAFGVSNLTLGEFDRLFASITINDFIKRADSNYTLGGDWFNLGHPTHTNPVAICFSTSTVGPTVTVNTTANFPSSGYLFVSTGAVISYTSISASSFDGCSFVKGTNNLTNGAEIVPHHLT